MMHRTLLGFLVLVCGVFFASRETSSVQTLDPVLEIEAPQDKIESAPTAALSAKLQPVQQLREISGEKSNSDDSNDEPMMINLGADNVPDPGFEEEWESYRNEMYAQAQLTKKDLEKLTAIGADTFGIDGHSVNMYYEKLWAKDPDEANRYMDNYERQMKNLETKAYESYLGKERYQYLVEARDNFFETYNRKHGTRIYDPGW